MNGQMKSLKVMEKTTDSYAGETQDLEYYLEQIAEATGATMTQCYNKGTLTDQDISSYEKFIVWIGE